MSESPLPIGTISDPSVLRLARELRAVSFVLEASLVLVLMGSAALMGSVHAWAYEPFWWATVGLGLAAAGRAVLIRALRDRIGPIPFRIHSSERWLILDDESPYGQPMWGMDLGRRAVPRGPLLWAGLAFFLWASLGLIPMSPRLVALLNLTSDMGAAIEGGPGTLSVAPWDTLRGLGFLGSVLLLHQAAAAALSRPGAAGLFVRRLSGFALLLSIQGLLQKATGNKALLWVFTPEEGPATGGFGPFANRNHFAAYILLLLPVALGLFVSAAHDFRLRVGSKSNLRRWLVALGTQEGIVTIRRAVPVLACVGALVATTSRGAAIALIAALLLAGVVARHRGRVSVWAFGLVFVLAAAFWLGVESLGERFGMLEQNAPGRYRIWTDTLAKMPGRWATGYGFNAYGMAVSRTTAWSLPLGATAWIAPYETSVVGIPSAGFSTLESLPGLNWYREAHNDYLQVFAETGVIGLFLVLWAAWRLLKAAAPSPAVFAALVAVLLHAFVEFGLQIPAVAMLFVVIAAVPARRKRQDPVLTELMVDSRPQRTGSGGHVA